MSKREQRRAQGLTPLNNQSLQAVDASIYGFVESVNNSTLSQQADGSYKFGSFSLTSHGFEMPKNVTSEEFFALGEMLFRMEGSLQWLIGDFALNAKEGTSFGEAYVDLMDKYDRSYSTVSKYKQTAERIPFFRRRKKLGWSHHTEIAQADLTDPQRWALLEECESADWSVKILRDEIAKVQGKTLPPPTTPLDRARDSNLKSVLKVQEKAKKSSNRAGWAKLARDMATRWQQLADDLD